MTIAGICFCTYLAYYLLKFGVSKDFIIKIIFIDAIFAIFKVNYGYIIKLGSEEILSSEITLLTLSISSLFYLKNLKIKFHLLLCSASIVFISLLSLFMLGLNPTEAPVVGYNNSGWDGYMRGEARNFAPPELNAQNFKMLLRLIAYTYILVFIWSYLKRCDWEELRQKINLSIIIYLSICTFELIIERIFNYDFSNILTTVFGLGRATGIDIERTQGLSREPSYYAIALYYTTILIINDFFSKKHSTINRMQFLMLLAVISALALSSGSLSVLVFFAPLFLYYHTFIPMKSRLLTAFLTIFIVCITWILMYDAATSFLFYDRLMLARSAFLKGLELSYSVGTDYSSEFVRLISIIETYNAFESRIWHGVGIGSIYSLSGIISILGNIGILGFGIWVLLLFYTNHKQPFMRVIALLLPFILVSDLNTLYDPAFIYLIPLAIPKS